MGKNMNGKRDSSWYIANGVIVTTACVSLWATPTKDRHVGFKAKVASFKRRLVCYSMKRRKGNISNTTMERTVYHG